MGLHVTAVASPRNAELAEALGADRVIDYTSSDFTDQGCQYDVVVDVVGNRRLGALRRVVRSGGALVLSGGGTSGEGRTVGPMRLLIGAAASARFLPFDVLTPQAVADATMLGRIAQLVEADDIRPVIDRTFPLEETPVAIHYLETKHAQAKVVITVR
jgi:NADPH:quinone reductase-like Zn-dependent oxidoreductase